MHKWSSDSGLNHLQKILWMILNWVNNHWFPNWMDSNLSKGCFYPVVNKHSWNATYETMTSPSRTLAKIFMLQLPWREICLELGDIHVLDIGCGPAEILDSLPTVKYFGYDIIEDIDVILVMSVNPGFMGQELVPQTIGKIEKIKERIVDMNLDIKISVDGNVNYENIPKMVSSGADILVGGSSGLFRSDIDLDDSIKRLRECIQEGLENR